MVTTTSYDMYIIDYLVNRGKYNNKKTKTFIYRK